MMVAVLILMAVLELVAVFGIGGCIDNVDVLEWWLH